MHITAISHTLPLQPIAKGGLLLGLLMHQPTGAISGGLQQFFGTRVAEHVQAVLQRVGIGRDGQLVNKAFMRK